jgi:hypothetical protein
MCSTVVVLVMIPVFYLLYIRLMEKLGLHAHTAADEMH